MGYIGKISVMMKKNIYVFLLPLAFLSACSRPASEAARGKTPYKVVSMIPTTPVKDQGRSPLCWDYAMLATMESEHLAKGDSVNLSANYVARMMLREKAREYYFSKGTMPISMRGMASMAIHYIEKYGAEPYDSYKDPENLNYNVLVRKTEKLAQASVARGKGLDAFLENFEDTADDDLGALPGNSVFMLGAVYTPREFAHSVCAPGEYLFLTSFIHHPFYKPFVLEVPDNQMKDRFYNLPIGELMAHIRAAIVGGHPVCWEGDVTEKDFGKKMFVDTGRKVTQEYRQRKFENLQTTDDHAMAIVGLVEYKGKEYYKCKNSWGDEWGDKGYVYLSADYIALNTIAVFMNRDAYNCMKKAKK